LLSIDINKLVGNKLGTGKVEDFTGLEGANFDEVMSRIPSNAKARLLVPNPKVQIGTEFKWVDDASNETFKVRIHGPDSSPNLPVGANARHGWITIVEKEVPKTSGGKQRLIFNPGSGKFVDKKNFVKAVKTQNKLPLPQRGLNLDTDPVNLSHMPVQVPANVKNFINQRTLNLYSQ